MGVTGVNVTAVLLAWELRWPTKRKQMHFYMVQLRSSPHSGAGASPILTHTPSYHKCVGCDPGHPKGQIPKLTFVDRLICTASKSLSTSRLFVFHSSKLVVLRGCASISRVTLSKFCSNRTTKKDISL